MLKENETGGIKECCVMGDKIPQGSAIFYLYVCVINVMCGIACMKKNMGCA
ncbi:hypothetical protein GCM10023262_11780 [Bartonella pachyuromydis]|uniref:Uncharacterized protein n=1 Tax=Bartonella pachyuromydis TaxID=931097 RepID=A0ABP8VJA1_9HYPH